MHGETVKIYEPLPNSGTPKGDTKQVRCRGPTIMERVVNVTFIWRLPLGARDPIHILVRQEKISATITLKILGATV